MRANQVTGTSAGFAVGRGARIGYVNERSRPATPRKSDMKGSLNLSKMTHLFERLTSQRADNPNGTAGIIRTI